MKNEKKQMTKKMLVKHINNLIKQHTKQLEKEIDTVLKNSGYCYGCAQNFMDKNGKVSCKRNAKDFVIDGYFDLDDCDVEKWIHTKDEVKKMFE